VLFVHLTAPVLDIGYGLAFVGAADVARIREKPTRIAKTALNMAILLKECGFYEMFAGSSQTMRSIILMEYLNS
jgi:hypothetical protein